MNHKLLIQIIGLLCFLVNLRAQELIGIYSGKYGDSLNFKSSTDVEFNLSTGSGLTMNFKGIGKYEMMNNHIFIQPIRTGLSKIFVQLISNNFSDSIIEFKIVDDKNRNPVDSVTVTLLKNEEIIDNKLTDINGCARLKIKGVKNVVLECCKAGYLKVSEKLDEGIRFEYSSTYTFKELQAFLNNGGKGFEYKIDIDEDKKYQFSTEPIDTVLYLWMFRYRSVRFNANDPDTYYEKVKFKKTK